MSRWAVAKGNPMTVLDIVSQGADKYWRPVNQLIFWSILRIVWFSDWLPTNSKQLHLQSLPVGDHHGPSFFSSSEAEPFSASPAHRGGCAAEARLLGTPWGGPLAAPGLALWTAVADTAKERSNESFCFFSILAYSCNFSISFARY